MRQPVAGSALASQPVSLIGTPLRAARAPLSLPELLTYAPLVLPTPETALRAAFDGLIDQLGITPNIAAEADDMAMLRLLARADAGFAVLPPIARQGRIAPRAAGRAKTA